VSPSAPGLGLAGRAAGAVAGWARSAIPAADLDARDPDYIRDKLPGLWLLATIWHRAEVRGLDHIPADGPVLLVGNHSGGNASPDTLILTLAGGAPQPRGGARRAAPSRGGGRCPAPPRAPACRPAAPSLRSRHVEEVAVMETPTPGQLAALLEGVDDATIEDQVTALGVDALLGQVFEEMARRFLPEKAAGRSAVVQYEVGLRDGSVRSWQVIVDGAACTVQPGSERPAAVTLQIALSPFLRVLTGSLDGMTAFMSGVLKVKGDVMLAQLMQGWFDRA
jgi:putative sterol carrier protein